MIFLFLFVVLFVMFGSFSSASAYIDPATTSYMLELIIGIVVVGGAAFGYYWRKIKNKGSGKENQKSGVSVEKQL